MTFQKGDRIIWQAEGHSPCTGTFIKEHLPNCNERKTCYILPDTPHPSFGEGTPYFCFYLNEVSLLNNDAPSRYYRVIHKIAEIDKRWAKSRKGNAYALLLLQL